MNGSPNVAHNHPVDPAANEATEPMPLPHYLPHLVDAPVDELALAAKIAEIDADTTTVPEGFSTRGWVQEAPTLQTVMNEAQTGDYRYQARMFAERPAVFYGIAPDDPGGSSETFLVDHSEQDAVYDLVHKMLEVEKVLGEALAQGASSPVSLEVAIAGAQDIRENLRVIGQEDLVGACRGIATHWLDLLSADDRDLFIGIRYTTDSSSYLYAMVESQLRTMLADRDDADALSARIHTMDLAGGTPIEEQKQAVQNGRLVIVDDWAITGRQMENVVNEVLYQYDLYPADIEIDMVCASSEQLAGGLGGATVRSYYKRPSVEDSTQDAGVTGLQHGVTDFGFRDIIDECYRELRQVPGYENYPYPILYSTARPYRTPKYTTTDYSGNQAILTAARETHAALVNELLKNGDSAAKNSASR